MVTYDPETLRQLATRLHARARYIAIVYAALLLLLGLTLGAGTVVSINLARRAQQIRRRSDLVEMSQNKREEALSLLRHAPLGALLTGAALGAFGLIVGRARATDLRVQAQTALCLVKIEANTQR